MDTRSTKTTADAVMNALYHPTQSYSSARVAKMTRQYVFLPVLLSVVSNRCIVIGSASSRPLPLAPSSVSSRPLISSSRPSHSRLSTATRARSLIWHHTSRSAGIPVGASRAGHSLSMRTTLTSRMMSWTTRSFAVSERLRMTLSPGLMFVHSTYI